MDNQPDPTGTYIQGLAYWDDEFRTSARTLRVNAPDEANLIDLAGALKSIEQFCGRERRLIESEIPADPGPGTVEAQGAVTTATAGRTAKRSFNIYAIIADAQANGLTIYDLIDEDALRVTGQWTNLKRVFHNAMIALAIAPHEIDNTMDGDDAKFHVGERWVTGSYTYDRKEE